MTTCTYEASLFGIGLGACGQPAGLLVRATCPAGHVDETPNCAEHIAQITDPDAPQVNCLGCFTEHDELVAVTSVVAGPVVHGGQLALDVPAAATS